MSRIDSRQKGARGERELAHLLTEHGYPARRGQQFSGSPDSPDVVCKSLAKLMQIECKWVQALNIHKAVAQAQGDAGKGQIPTVMHKKNGTEWLMTMPLEDFLGILKTHPLWEPGVGCCGACGSDDVADSAIFRENHRYKKCNKCGNHWR